MTYFEAGSNHMNRIGLYKVVKVIDDEKMIVRCEYDDIEKEWIMEISERIETNMRREVANK